MEEIQEKTGSLLRSIAKNSAALLAVKIFMPLSYFIITISLARMLGVKSFGVYSIIFAYYGILRIIATFGIDSFLIKEIARDRSLASFYLNNAYFLGIIFSCINIVIMNAALSMSSYSYEVKMAGFVLSLALLPASLTQYAEAVFIAFQKNQYIFFTTSIREVLKITLVIFALIVYKSLLSVIIVISLTSYFGLLLDMVVINAHFFRQKLMLRREPVLRILKASFTLVLISGISSFFIVMDIIVLSKIKGELAVGLYSAAYKFVAFAFLFIDSIGLTLLPVMSQFYQNAIETFNSLVVVTFRYFAALALLFSVSVFLFSDKIIILIFGNSFAASASILNVLIWIPLFLGSSYFFGRMLFAANMQKYDLIAIFSACITGLALNVLFTMKWGYMGTAVAVLISTLFLFFLHFYFFYNKVFPLNIGQVFIKPFIACFPFFIGYFYAFHINRYVWFAGSVVIYFLMLTILGVVKKQEIIILAKSLAGKK